MSVRRGRSTAGLRSRTPTNAKGPQLAVLRSFAGTVQCSTTRTVRAERNRALAAAELPFT
jgi:hypothetical protein